MSPTIVLLVDDQPIVGEAVRRMLAADPSIAFHFCRDPREAIETATRVRPTVILQDLVMPEIDGLDLVTEYRRTEVAREVPLIVLSSREEATTKAEAFARGANDYLVKLPDPIELLARVRHHSRGYTALLERNAAFAALESSRKHLADEIDRAAEYVRSLLDPPISGRVGVRWTFLPSSSLGGDCFGYRWIDNDRFAIFILDVCGHGVGPALLGVTALNDIRAAIADPAMGSDPAALLARINEAFPMRRHRNMYFTMWYGVVDRGAGTLTYSGAAHPPAVLFRAGRAEYERLDSDGLPIGVAPSPESTNRAVPIGEGDLLYLYSDGVFEIQQRDGTMWSMEEFLEFMAAAPATDRIGAIAAHTRAMLDADGYADDFSIVEATIGPR
ncbi:MAG TPA: SpoIIE family protein phosphatase [Phycisphaerales bacterium]|nr:SpoIIE family protein phosphatase [Phycisphaerales bacterium]